MKGHFFAYLSRMRLIQRWGLMRNTYQENIQEHSLQVAMVAHALALIYNRFFGGNLDAERVMALAVFHEVGEVFTGDLATPIKYFNPEIKQAYDEIETIAKDKLCAMLPAELQAEYRDLFFVRDEERELWLRVKAADKICAYIKCLEELKAGNREFVRAAQTILEELQSNPLPETAYFMEHFVPSFELPLDEMH